MLAKKFKIFFYHPTLPILWSINYSLTGQESGALDVQLNW